MTYRTAGPQYQQILRTSLEPVLADFEAVWSDAWLPRGTVVRFQRAQLLREDLATSMGAAVAGVGAGIITQPEGRVMVGLPPDETGAAGSARNGFARRSRRQPVHEADPSTATDPYRTRGRPRRADT